MILELDPNDIQGNILRGYRSTLGAVRHLICEVTDRAAARRFLALAAAGGSPEVPAITTDVTWPAKQTMCFNIGLTFEGLKALGTPVDSLATFPTEFVQGMTSRAARLADYGPSAPDTWPAPFDQPERVHLVATIYASNEAGDDDAGILNGVEAQVARAFNIIGIRNGASFPENKVHFGYVDSISQPHFRPKEGGREPADPLGTILLGYPTRLEGLLFRVPQPPELGHNGSFNAFRVLEQDVVGFEAYLDHAARELEGKFEGDKIGALFRRPGDEHRIVEMLFGRSDGPPADVAEDRFRALRESVAAQLCGRWRNGVPLALSPDLPDPATSQTDFDYTAASPCPVGSHLRRVNPRGGKMVQRIANFTRRLVRRGTPYGPRYDPAKPDNEERGLLGNFIGANIAAQFEAIMCDWLNLGLQDPAITRSNDPLLGANEVQTSWFDFGLKDGTTYRLRGFPRFVRTRGGAYTFLPSMAAIRYLSELKG